MPPLPGRPTGVPALGTARASDRPRPGAPPVRRGVPAPALAQWPELPGLHSQQNRGGGRCCGAAGGGAG
eukprot:8906058-Lingulodinium_polyedra.AAC.1